MQSALTLKNLTKMVLNHPREFLVSVVVLKSAGAQLDM